MAMRWLACFLLAACGNNLPPSGSCEIAVGGEAATVTPVQLVGRSAAFDDLRYAPQLGKVLAAPQGTGKLFIVDPDSLDVVTVGVPGGTASADANATTIYIADRGNDRIISIDATTLQPIASHDVGASPDYVRVAPTENEIWVTLPGRDRFEILDAVSLAQIDTVELPIAPEGIVFDATGRAYTQSNGRVIAVDVASRIVVGEWEAGCGLSHGFPQVDDDYGLVVAGCFANGGAAVLTNTGDLRSGIEAGGGEAILAHDGARHHLYLRGDPGPTLDIIAVCSDGGMSVLETVPIPNDGHGATVDDRGHAWVVDATSGGLLRITDPYPSTN